MRVPLLACESQSAILWVPSTVMWEFVWYRLRVPLLPCGSYFYCHFESLCYLVRVLNTIMWMSSLLMKVLVLSCESLSTVVWKSFLLSCESHFYHMRILSSVLWGSSIITCESVYYCVRILLLINGESCPVLKHQAMKGYSAVLRTQVFYFLFNVS